MNTPPYFVQGKEVVFHIKGGFPTTALLPSIMKNNFPSDFSCSVVRCEETWNRLREKSLTGEGK